MREYRFTILEKVDRAKTIIYSVLKPFKRGSSRSVFIPFNIFSFATHVQDRYYIREGTRFEF